MAVPRSLLAESLDSARNRLLLGILAVLLAACVLPASASALGFVQAPGGPYWFGSEESQDVATGDLNGDGRDDVVSVNWGPLFDDSPGYSVMLANADGSLSPAPGGAVSMSTEPYRVALGNFDGDNNLDMALTIRSHVNVYAGNGNGTFSASPVTSLAVGPGAIGIAVGDLNGDTRDDVVAANHDAGTVSVFYAFGEGASFTEYFEGPISVGATEPIAVAVGDLDGNGSGDIVTANRDQTGINQKSISVLLATNEGTYGSPTLLQGEYRTSDIALGNVDAGPTLDIVTVSSPNNGAVVKLGNGDGTFSDAPGGPFSFPSRFSDSLVLADLDGNGRDDVSIPISTSISGNEDNTIWVFGSAADGSLSPVEGNPFSVWRGSYPDSIAAGDFDGDGTPDLVTANGSEDLTVLLRDDTPQPDPVMEPEWLDFGEGKIGQTSAPQDVTIANEGPGVLELSSLYRDEDSDQYGVDLSDCPAELEQGEECTAKVTFAPTSIGGKSANLRMPRALGPPATVSLYGWGEAVPSAEISPTSHDFGSLEVGEGPSGVKTFFVENTSQAWIEIDSVTLAGTDPEEFEIEYDDCEDETLRGEGEYCEVDVSFDPESTVGEKSAELIVESAELDAPLVATLSGEAEANPAIFVNPESWDAGTVEVGGAGVSGWFYVWSYGSTPTEIGSVALTGADAGDFSIVTDECSDVSLGQYQECAIEVQFSPGSAGVKSATLEIPSNAPGAPHQLSLEGTGEGTPRGTVTPPSHDFEGVPFNTPSEPQAFTLESTGGADLEVDSVVVTGEAKGFQMVSDECSETVLAPGESCVVEARLKPQTYLDLNAEVQFDTNAADPQPKAELTGSTHDNPGISMTPGSHDFGDVLLGGGPSDEQRFVVESTGTTEVVVSGLGLNGANVGDFNIASSTCQLGALEPGETCLMDVAFNPKTAGAKVADLVVTSTVGETARASLSGTGLVRSLYVSPLEVDAGSLPVGDTTTLFVTLQSTGNAPVTVESASLTSGDTGQFSVVGSCVGEIEVAQSCVVEVEFEPTEIGEHEATLTVAANAPGSPWEIELTGTGVASPNISLTPTSHDFGNVIVGLGPSATQTFTVESTGATDLALGEIELAGTDPGEFSLTDGCPATLAPTTTCAIEVAFDPTSEGQKSATLSVASDAPGSPATAGLAGFGVAPEQKLEIAPASHDFGGLAIGSQGPAQTFTIESTGNVPVTIGNHGIGISGMAGNFVPSAEDCLSAQLAPGESCDMEVSFKPTELGAIEAELLVYTDAGGAPAATADLSGTGLANPGIAATPTSLDFGSRTVGEGPSAPRTVTVESTGTTPLEFDRVIVEGAAEDQFAIETNGCAGTLAPGEECEVAVTFAPSTVGAKQASLVVVSNAERLELPLAGSGEARPAPPAPAPPVTPPAPPACTTPEVKQPTVFVPTRKETPKVPGLRARFALGAPAVLEVTAKLRYRVDGKARTASLGKQTLHPGGSTANYKVAIPSRLRKTLVPGTAVKLELRYRSRGTESACTEFGPAKTKNLATKVVWIKPS